MQISAHLKRTDGIFVVGLLDHQDGQGSSHFKLKSFPACFPIRCHLNTSVRRLLAATTGCARDFTVSTVEVMGFATCPTSSIAPSTSRMPDLNALMPLAKSPITRGSFPAPNRIMTMAKTTSQCMMLNEPILQRPKEVENLLLSRCRETIERILYCRRL